MDFSETYGDSVGGISAAARSGFLVGVRTLIRAGLSLDVKDNRGWTCLHEGAAQGHKGCVREILRAAAASSTLDFCSFVNSQTHEGETAMFLAAQYGQLSVVKLLLKAKADINLQTHDLSCPLYAAVDGGHTQVVMLLLQKGVEVNRSHTASCWTCLHQAVYKGHSEIVRLLSTKADLKSVDDYGITPLFLAAQYGQFTCLKALTSAGADVDFQAADGATPLLIASQEGHEDCVVELLVHRADPNLKCSNDWPQLPIHAAAQFGHIRVLKQLIPFTDRSIGHAPGQVSPVYLAVLSGHKGALEVLLREGFSPNAQDCEDLLGLRSPLTQAVDLALCDTNRGIDTVKILLFAGATVFRETWALILKSDKADFLQLVLDLRIIPGPSVQSPVLESPGLSPGRDLTEQEMKDLFDECQHQTQTSFMWMPLLLKAGLEPHTLLQDKMCSEAPGAVLNLLLQHLNWSCCISPDQRVILDQRRTDGTWDALPIFDSIPCLFHLCRLHIREVLGSASVMKTTILCQLPVPVLFHHFLRFRDIQ